MSKAPRKQEPFKNEIIQSLQRPLSRKNYKILFRDTCICVTLTEVDLSGDNIKIKNDGNKSIVMNGQLQGGRDTAQT